MDRSLSTLAAQATPPIPSRFQATNLRRCLGLLLLGLGPAVFALGPKDRFGLKDLENEPKMTPGHFADLFGEFAYDYFPYVQSPDTFLQNRLGDCDDYAIMADHVLSRRDYHTRLVRVDLVGTNISHVVCYVTEQKVYLDYNNRRFFFNLERSRPTLRAIAEKVADSFEKNWTSATEYTYAYEDPRPQTVWTVVKTESAELDPDIQPRSPTR